MRKPLGILWAIVLLSITITAYAQDTTSVKARPKVGLVLSGGGAKGAAHIGVLKYIEEAEIPIDYIAGTSMGAIVGGMYAMGYSADEILDLISAVDWDRLISNQVDRQRTSYTSKAESRTQLITIPFSVRTDEQELQSRTFKNSLPTGIVSGDNLINLFNNHYLTAIINYARSGIDMKNFFKERETLLWEDIYGYNASNWWGAGIRYSIDTKMGPLSFDISSSNISKNAHFYFNLGYYF